MDIIDLSKHARFDDFFDHTHIGIKARLKADGKNPTGLFFGLNDFRSLFNGHGKRFFDKNVYPGVQRVNDARCVLTIIGADADGVELFLGEHFLVACIAVNALYAEFIKKGLRLAGNDIRAANDLCIRAI